MLHSLTCTSTQYPASTAQAHQRIASSNAPLNTCSTTKWHTAPPTQPLTFLQYYLPVLHYAKASPPTNVGHSNPPNQLPTYHFTFSANTNHNVKPAASCHTLYTTLPPLSFPPSPTQCTALQLPNPIQSFTRICALSCIYPHQLRGNIR